MGKLTKKLLFLFENTPERVLFLGILFYILMGFFLLSLPVCQNFLKISAIDNLFIATSAVSTTGLVTISISECYSLIGQLIILILIQLGGIGYMTFGTFIILVRKKTIPSFNRDVLETSFSLPLNFHLGRFIMRLMLFTIFIELTGTVVLYFIFNKAGIPNSLWVAFFHSVSAFCTAGFSTFNSSFEGFASNTSLNVVTGILSYIGSMGFIVIYDFFNKITGKTKEITFTSKIIIFITMLISIFGTTTLFFTEPSIYNFPLKEKILASFYQTMSSMTTVGFNTIPVNKLAMSSLILTIIMMYIGSSPAGTGGGVKSTTITAVYAFIKSKLKRQENITFWNREIPAGRINVALCNFVLYPSILLLGLLFLTFTDKGVNFLDLFFEATSALGTVGLSTGITAFLSFWGKIIIIALMYVGRLGVLVFGTTIFLKNTKFYKEIFPKEDISI